MKFYLKYIFLFLILVFPFVMQAQTKEDLQRKYEELKAKGYNVDKAKALLGEDSVFSASDSISKIRLLLDQENTRFKSIEEAEKEVEGLLERVSSDKNTYKRRNGALAVRIGQNTVIKNKERDRVARDAWSDMLQNKNATTEDFAALYERFGNKPTYYVNDIQVDQKLLNKVRESDVMKREYRVKNTQSGNPNGEVWYTITKKAAKRIKLDKYELED